MSIQLPPIGPSASQREDVPAGVYTAEFVGLSTQPVKEGTETALRWTFRVTGGPHAGTEISDLSDLTGPTPDNKLGRYIAALAKKPPVPGTSVNWQEYVGRRYCLVVQPKANGKTKLTSFTQV